MKKAKARHLLMGWLNFYIDMSKRCILQLLHDKRHCLCILRWHECLASATIRMWNEITHFIDNRKD